jgi:hypothetical protein
MSFDLSLPSRYSRTLFAATVGVLTCGVKALAGFELVGGEFAPAGTLPGDQQAPAAAWAGQRGIVVWEGNSVDESGAGIGGRWLDSTQSGVFSPFRLNEVGAGDQVNPAVAMQADGTTAVVWESGLSGSRRVHARLLSATGTFLTGDLVLGSDYRDNSTPAVIAAPQGGFVVIWTAANPGFYGSDIKAQLISSAGQLTGAEVTVNEIRQGNQQRGRLASLADGTLVCVWVHELPEQIPASRLFGIRLDASLQPLSAQFPVDSFEAPVKWPSVVASGTGFAVGWNQLSEVTADTWDIKLRWFSSVGVPLGQARTVNIRTAQSQQTLALAASGDTVLAVYESSLGDGSGLGIVGRALKATEEDSDGELIFNASRVGDQFHPAVSATGLGQFTVLWANWTGLDNGVDVWAQRYALAGQPLAAMAAPYVEGLSSWQVRVTWPALAGQSVRHYEVYLNGAVQPVIVTDNYWDSSDLLPGTAHQARVTYVLEDGRRAPLSVAGTGRTWGKDLNGNGLPDDWEAIYFGANPANWPAPNVDSDSDGIPNRNEFLAGTSPTDATDFLAIKILTGDGEPRLTWNTKPGVIYQLQVSSDLLAWTSAGNPRRAAGTADAVPVGPASGQAYFRIIRLR